MGGNLRFKRGIYTEAIKNLMNKSFSLKLISLLNYILKCFQHVIIGVWILTYDDVMYVSLIAV